MQASKHVEQYPGESGRRNERYKMEKAASSGGLNFFVQPPLFGVREAIYEAPGVAVALGRPGNR